MARDLEEKDRKDKAQSAERQVEPEDPPLVFISCDRLSASIKTYPSHVIGKTSCHDGTDDSTDQEHDSDDTLNLGTFFHVEQVGQ